MNKPEEPEELTADSWEFCDDLKVYGSYLSGDDEFPQHLSERKARLVMVAALRAVSHLICDERSIESINAAERFADDTRPEPLEVANTNAYQAHRDATTRWGADRSQDQLEMTLSWTAYQCSCSIGMSENADGLPFWCLVVSTVDRNSISNPANRASNPVLLALFRDLFPNPFRPVAFDPSWRTPDVAALAVAIYDGRAWDRMPILADALEEAGCADARVLDHCRSYPVHARGCWVVDAILGKS